MGMTAHVTFSLEEAQKAELERLADLENTTVEALVSRLVQIQLDDYRLLRAEIQKGVDSAENERLIDHDDVFSMIRSRIGQRRA